MIHIQKPAPVYDDEGNEISPAIPLYYTAYTDAGTVRHVGVTEVGRETMSGQPDWIATESEQAQLNACSGIDFTDWNELPPPPEGSEQGAWVEAGPYSYEGDLINCIQAHNRTIYAPQDTPALFNWALDETDPEWQIGVPYEVDYEVMYESVAYKCLQAHTSQAGWTPSSTPALWQEVVELSAVWSTGVDYTAGDQVYYPTENDTLYECLQSHTSQAGWTPAAVASLWSEI